MGKSSRRVSRVGQSKEERKNNFKQARKNHLYNQATCKSTNRIKRNVITSSGTSPFYRGGRAVMAVVQRVSLDI